MAPLNILFICQVVDVHDPIMATTLQWIETLSNDTRVHHVTVLTIREGKHSFGERVTVVKVGGGGRVLTLIRFYKALIDAFFKKKISAFLIYQGGVYPLFLIPFKKLFNIPIFQWRAHPYVTAMARFCVEHCTTVHFTSTKSAFIDRPNVMQIGQGVNVGRFTALSLSKQGDLITVGRISPIKGVDLVITAVDLCRQKYQRRLRFQMFGPVFAADEEYFSSLREMVKKRGLEDQVFFPGVVPHDKLPEVYNQHLLYINLSKTALDRAVVEAMACGVPVLSSNPCVEEILPEKYKEALMIKSVDEDSISEKIEGFFTLDTACRQEMSNGLRENIVKNHSHTGQMDKIVNEILREIG